MRERKIGTTVRPSTWPPLREDDPGRSEIGDDRGRLIELACRGAMLILEARADREDVLRRDDPVPASTKELLRGLARG